MKMVLMVLIPMTYGERLGLHPSLEEPVNAKIEKRAKISRRTTKRSSLGPRRVATKRKPWEEPNRWTIRFILGVGMINGTFEGFPLNEHILLGLRSARGSVRKSPRWSHHAEGEVEEDGGRERGDDWGMTWSFGGVNNGGGDNDDVKGEKRSECGGVAAATRARHSPHRIPKRDGDVWNRWNRRGRQCQGKMPRCRGCPLLASRLLRRLHHHRLVREFRPEEKHL